MCAQRRFLYFGIIPVRVDQIAVVQHAHRFPENRPTSGDFSVFVSWTDTLMLCTGLMAYM